MGDRVFVTTAVSSDESAAFDPTGTSGRLIGADTTARQSCRVLAVDKDAGYVGLPDYQWGTASAPLLDEGKVIVQCDSREGSFLAAFDAASGEPLWRQNRDELPSWSTPIIYREEARTEIITSSSAQGASRWASR